MPKFTYPIVFILHEDSGLYNGFIPDLGLFLHGEKLEDVYSDAEEKMYGYFEIAGKHNIECPAPSSLEDITAKWKGFKVSLLTARLPDVS